MHLTSWRAFCRNIGLFLGWLPLIWVSPFVAIGLHVVLPRLLGNFLFFWPQSFFPYQTFHHGPPNVEGRVWPGVWVIYWLVIACWYAWFTRQRRASVAFVLAGLAVLLATIALHMAISGLGLYFELDGP